MIIILSRVIFQIFNVVTLKCGSQVTHIGAIQIRQTGCGFVLVFGSNFVPNTMMGLGGDQNIFQINLVIWTQ